MREIARWTRLNQVLQIFGLEFAAINLIGRAAAFSALERQTGHILLVILLVVQCGAVLADALRYRWRRCSAVFLGPYLANQKPKHWFHGSKVTDLEEFQFSFGRHRNFSSKIPFVKNFFFIENFFQRKWFSSKIVSGEKFRCLTCLANKRKIISLIECCNNQMVSYCNSFYCNVEPWLKYLSSISQGQTWASHSCNESLLPWSISLCLYC